MQVCVLLWIQITRNTRVQGPREQHRPLRDPPTLPPISFKAAAHGSGSAVSRPQRLQGPHTSEPPREAAGLCSISVVSDPQVKQVNFPPALPSPFCALAAGWRGNAVKAGSSQSTAHSRASHGRLGEALHHRRDRWSGPNFLPCVLTKRQAPCHLSYLSRGRTMGRESPASCGIRSTLSASAAALFLLPTQAPQ